MTGTPLDLTPFGPLLKALGPLYWLAAALCIALALWLLEPWWLKLGVTVAFAAASLTPVLRHKQERQDQFEAARARLDAATARFEMRCNSAGEKITRTADNVEGIAWMKWRGKLDANDDYDQFKLSDPYGRDCNGKSCIRQLLRASKGLEHDPQKQQSHYRGYRYVESADPADGTLNRYSLRLTQKDPRLVSLPEPVLDEEVIEKRTARYGVAWDDISTREDRELWIAGGSIKVIDLQTNQVIGERVGYMMDSGQGSREGFRTPWAMARRAACPAFPGGMHRYPVTDSVVFVQKVLRPTEEK